MYVCQIFQYASAVISKHPVGKHQIRRILHGLHIGGISGIDHAVINRNTIVSLGNPRHSTVWVLSLIRHHIDTLQRSQFL